MTNTYTMEDLLEFLNHASDKGLMPSATAKAMAVGARKVLGVLEEDEQRNIGNLDLDAVIKRFNNKRAKDFNPSSLKEYDRRVRRAIELYEEWVDNPANFSVKARTPRQQRKKPNVRTTTPEDPNDSKDFQQISVNRPNTFQSAFPVGPGRVITISNIPEDLSSNEAERLAQFVRMLAVG